MVKKNTVQPLQPFDWGKYPPLVSSMGENEEWLLDLISNAPKSASEIKDAWAKKNDGKKRTEAEQLIGNLSKYGIIVSQNDRWTLIPHLLAFHKTCEDFFYEHKLVPEELCSEHLKNTCPEFIQFVKGYFNKLAPINIVLRNFMATVPAIVAYKYYGVIQYGIDWERHENEKATLYGLLIVT